MEKAQILSESRKICRCIRGISIACSACCSAFFLVGELTQPLSLILRILLVFCFVVYVSIIITQVKKAEKLLAPYPKKRWEGNLILPLNTVEFIAFVLALLICSALIDPVAETDKYINAVWDAIKAGCFVYMVIKTLVRSSTAYKKYIGLEQSDQVEQVE